MKKKMLMFRNQFLILGFGSLMIVSCSKEDLENVFGGGCHHDKTQDTTSTKNGSDECLTCGQDSSGENKDTIIYVDPNDGGNKNDSTETNGGGGVDPNDGNGSDSANAGGWKYFDSIYNNPNYDPNKDGLLLTQ